MKSKSLLSGFLLLLFPAFLAGAATPRVVDRLGLSSGLSNGYVLDIAHDATGYTWIATENGLNRWDGYEFRIFGTADGLSGEKLNALYHDPEENVLWIATQYDGLDRLDLTSNTFTTYRHNKNDDTSIADDYITSITPSPINGGLWITTYWDGLDHFDTSEGTFTHYNTKTIPDWVSDKTWCVAESRSNGELYIGLDDEGMMIYNPSTGRVRHFAHDPQNPRSIPGNNVRTILIDQAGGVWVGTSRGLALYNPSTEKFITILPDTRIFDLITDDEGRLWAACENDGIAIIDPAPAIMNIGAGVTAPVTRVMAGKTPSSLSCKTVHTLTRDAFGNFYAGTYGDGVDILTFQPRFFTTWTDTEGMDPVLTDKNIMTVQYNPVASNGSLWIGTDGNGIDIVKRNGDVQNLNSGNSALRDNAVTASFLDPRDGSMWFGTYSGQLLHAAADGSGLSDVPVEKPDDIPDIRSIAVDDQGKLYVGHAYGISIRDAYGNWKHLTASNNRTPVAEQVRALYIDSDGNIYAGSHGGGIMVYDSDMNHISTYASWKKPPRQIPFNFVNHFLPGDNNAVWAATTHGLVEIILRSDSVKVYGTADGLTDTNVRALAMDSNGILWLSTSGGVTRFDPKKKIFSNYGPGDGTADGDFISGTVTSGFDILDSAPDGETICFGSHYGLTVFNPITLHERPDMPAVRFTDITVFTGINDIPTHINPSDKIKLGHHDNTLRIAFSVLDPTLTAGVDYIYMLEGQSDTWFNNGNSNIVMLRNLRPGKYTLHVKALQNGISDLPDSTDSESTMAIIIKPPVWGTWWARLLYILLLGGVIYLAVMLYKRHLRLQNVLLLEQQNHRRELEVNDERMRFFTNITHELRTPLSLIIGPLRDMEENSALPPRELKRITMMRKSADRLLSMVNAILEFRKTETHNKQLAVSRGDLAALVEEMGIRYRELNTNRRVSYNIIIEPGDYTMLFDSATISTILDNLLSNATKYTTEGTITLKLAQGPDGTVTITVSDTGSGIRAKSIPHIFERYYQDANSTGSSTSTGIGLALVKNLVELHEGTIDVESREGEGSTFTVTLHADNTYPRAIHNSDVAETVAEIYTPEILDDTAPQSRPVILVVEDNQEICSYISDSLGDSYIVHTAPDGVVGLEKASTLVPDIIVSDIMMPRMDGMEMLKRLKSDVNTSHIPVILLTAKGSIEDRTDAYSTGAESFITKPFTSRLLRSRISNILEARRLLTERINSAPKPDDKARILAEGVSALDREFLEKLENLIDTDPASDALDVAYLAGKMNMSHSSLYRKVKALTGMSVNGFIRYKRIHRAEQLLLTGRHTISEIAMMVGINSLSNFRMIFKEEFGMTPSEYLASKR